jgi:hypothetical protein
MTRTRSYTTYSKDVDAPTGIRVSIAFNYHANLKRYAMALRLMGILA